MWAALNKISNASVLVSIKYFPLISSATYLLLISSVCFLFMMNCLTIPIDVFISFTPVISNLKLKRLNYTKVYILNEIIVGSKTNHGYLSLNVFFNVIKEFNLL